MSEKVNLVLYPQIQEGEDVDEVKGKLCKTLSVDLATVDTWFATENATAILKDVEAETAEKYVAAIQGCGAQCNLQPAGGDKSSWGLEEMSKADIRDLFICPSCEFEEQMERGLKMEQCPQCGLVIAKWEEKMRDEAEKEKIRRRLLRDQRLTGDRQGDIDAKKAELERLKALEREIMLELGIKPPGALWQLFEQYTFAISFGFTVVVVVITAIAVQYGTGYVEGQSEAELAAAAPSEEIQGIAPVMAAAMEMQQNGDQEVITEMADASQIMRGAGSESRQAIVGAAAQMMKGVDPKEFMAIAANISFPPATAKISAGELQPAVVNTATIGGVQGLQGVASFSGSELNGMSPPLLEHGHEDILSVLTEKRVVPDIYDPEGPDLIVEAIDEMDGSAIVGLMSSISRDQEWDQYLASHVTRYIVNGDIDSATNLADRIKNPVVRISAFGEIMEEHELNANASDVKVLSARVNLDLAKIKDPDTRARVILDLGKKLAEGGSQVEPYNSIDRVTRMAEDSDDPFEESYLTSRLAVTYMELGDIPQAKRLLQKSMRVAGRLKDLSDRISAFTRIAQRYYDVRNNTLASKILADAAILAATELEQQPRSMAFGEIALAQGYIGDFAGARISIDNAAEGKAKQQLIAKVAELLIGEKRYYESLAWMETLEDEVEYSRLELRLSSALFYAGRTREAINRMEQSAPRMQRIYELSERGLLTSQYARFFARLGQEERSEQLFMEAEEISKQLTGRKSQVNLALVALDRARVFQLVRARNIIVDELTDTVVRDPIDTEVLSTERIFSGFLPEDLSVYAEEK